MKNPSKKRNDKDQETKKAWESEEAYVEAINRVYASMTPKQLARLDEKARRKQR
jgi:hypothetical protein